MSYLDRCLSALFLISLLSLASARAEEPPRRWTNQAELSLVATNGNSETLTLGLGNDLTGTFEKWTFNWKIAALRADATTTTRSAIGAAGSFEVHENSDTDRTAESYLSDLRWDRSLGERDSVYLGLGWERNEFAGIRNRSKLLVGHARRWVDTEEAYFRTDHGVTMTDQEDVYETPDSDGSFAGLRLGWEAWRKLGANSKWGNDLVLDWNLEDTADWRIDTNTWLSVAMSKRLAVKLSYQLSYDAQPAAEAVDLFDPADLLSPIGVVPVELDELDGRFVAALTMTF